MDVHRPNSKHSSNWEMLDHMTLWPHDCWMRVTARFSQHHSFGYDLWPWCLTGNFFCPSSHIFPCLCLLPPARPAPQDYLFRLWLCAVWVFRIFAFPLSWLCLLMGVREFIYPTGQQAFWQQKSSSALPVPNKGPMNKLLNNISSRYLSPIYSLSGFCPAASFICLAPTVCSYKLSQFLPFWHLFVPLSSLLVSCATWPFCALSLSLLLLLLSHLYVFLLLLLFSLQSVISFFPSSTMSWLSFPIRKSGI